MSWNKSTPSAFGDLSEERVSKVGFRDERWSRDLEVDTPIDYRALFGALSVPHVLLTPGFDIVEMNAAYLAAVGRTRDELVGRNMFSAFPSSGKSFNLLNASLSRTRDEGVVDVIALIPYAITVNGELTMRYWSATHMPIRDGSGAVAYILQQTQDVTELQRLKEAAGMDRALLGDAVLRRAEAVQAVNTSLVAERTHLRRLFQQSPGFMCVLTGPDLVFDLANAAYLKLVGADRKLIGLPMRQAFPDLAGQGFFEILERVTSSGEPFVGRAMRILFEREGGGPPDEHFLDFVYQPIVEDGGRVTGIFVEGSDVTDQVRALERQRHLIDELNHRVKNVLATVQSIAAQTLRTRTPEQFAAAFQSRLMALARTHDALTRENWDGAPLRQLLEQELSPFGLSRIALRGESPFLPTRMALSFGMVLHELATNAALHGALSVEEGRLRVESDVVDCPNGGQGLVMEWMEEGGPRLPPKTVRGFGSRLVERSVQGEMKGELIMDYRPQGVMCRITVPLQGEA